MIHLLLMPVGTTIDVFGPAGEPLFAVSVVGRSRGSLVALRGAAREGLPRGHYLIERWTRGEAGAPARLELADVDWSTEARLIEAGTAVRPPGSRLLIVRGIAAPTGALAGRTGVAIFAAVADAHAAGGGLVIRHADLLFETDAAHGTIVLTVAGKPDALT